MTDASVAVSFEVYPPRSVERTPALHETILTLASVAPRFISVTFGAGGSSGGRSLELLRFILENTDVTPLAHLTCVGNTHEGSASLIREFLDAGITRFLALRGDPPEGSTEEDAFLGDVASAAELVQLIGDVRAERAPSTQAPLTGVARAPRVEPRAAAAKADIAVAAFPNGHPRSHDPQQDVDILLAKQAAGATFAITQLFFRADDYLGFVGRARDAGVVIPILPGIQPVTSPARLKRVLELSGEDQPADLAAALELAADDAERRAVGIAHAAALARAVLDGGAPGVHLYAFNAHSTVLAVLREAGIRTTAPDAVRTLEKETIR